jgi:hypothetical protein
MEPMTEPIERLAMLADTVDAGFASIHERQAAQMECRAGCSACCRARLAITSVEEAFLHRGLATLPETKRAELSARTLEEGREMCPALDADGRCDIYAFRPLICRSYGVPLRHRRAVELINPPVIDVCDLNFVDTPLKTLAPSDVLDQTELVNSLETIDRGFCADNGLPRGGRVSIAAILADSRRRRTDG